VVAATTAVTQAAPVHVYGGGRRCIQPGYITDLCQANPGPLCFCHEALATRTRLERQAAERVEAIDLMLQDYGPAG
jgi:hypothetical protein